MSLCAMYIKYNNIDALKVSSSYPRIMILNYNKITKTVNTIHYTFIVDHILKLPELNLYLFACPDLGKWRSLGSIFFVSSKLSNYDT